jgi:hypothetical protein
MEKTTLFASGRKARSEANDCALRGPHQNGDTIFRKNLHIDGRVELFQRDHSLNVRGNCFFWTLRMLWFILPMV